MLKLNNKGFSLIDTILGITIMFVVVAYIYNYPIEAQIGSKIINDDFVSNSEKIALSYIKKDIRDNLSSVRIEGNKILIDDIKYVFGENVFLETNGSTKNITKNKYLLFDDENYIYIKEDDKYNEDEFVIKINKKYSSVPVKS